MPLNESASLIQILLVEDNPGDVRLTQEVLRDAKVRNRMHHAADGEIAMRFMKREGEFADAPRPDIVLLDLNIPRMDGRQVLAAMKSDPDLLRIPVIVLTTSKADEDIAKSYSLHANCYIAKPVDFDAFIRVVRSIEDFWLAVVRLPS